MAYFRKFMEKKIVFEYVKRSNYMLQQDFEYGRANGKIVMRNENEKRKSLLSD